VKLLREQFSLGVGGTPQVSEIELAYARLIPDVKFSWPGMGTGLAASVDRVKKVTIGVVFVSANVTAHEGLGFSSYEDSGLHGAAATLLLQRDRHSLLPICTTSSTAYIATPSKKMSPPFGGLRPSN
jgi:hypothetical protein